MMVLVKYGGAAMEDLSLCQKVADEIVSLVKSGLQPIVVHGGGKEITGYMKRFGVESRFISGLRYTDVETLTVSEMLLSGLINKRLVSGLNQAGANAVGISGRDGRMLTLSQVTDRDLGFVGEVKTVDASLIRTLIGAGYLPVISPISENTEGHPLNVNADEAATELAIALQVNDLLFLSDIDGLQIGGRTIERLNVAEAGKLLSHPEVTAGMIPKLQGAVKALQEGVGRVRFLNGTRPSLIGDVLLRGGTSGSVLEP